MLHIVLDIDNTLITHSIDPHCKNKLIANSEISGAYYRTGLIKFLDNCFDNFASVSLWSTSIAAWVSRFVNSLPDQMHNKFLFTWAGNKCTICDDIPIKSLKSMWNTNLARDIGMTEHNTVIVDDNKCVCIHNPKNHLQITAYYQYSDKPDNALDTVYATLIEKQKLLVKA